MKFTGQDAWRVWLTEQGFTVGINSLPVPINECNWYAWRKIKYPARPCHCNEKPPSFCITPFLWTINQQPYVSAEACLTGEQSGIWYQLKAYSISEEELKTRLDEIEDKLIAAWNALEVL
jgi:hypothetical protein